MFARTVLTGIVFLLLLSKPALGTATDWYVDGSVASSGGGQTWGAAFKSIQEGIEAASDGDSVTVAPGAYLENINFAGKNITLRSTDPPDPDIVGATIVDGNQAGSVVTFDATETETCILSGFTIRNGKSDYGGGISVAEWSWRGSTHATVESNIITGNSADREGGGLFRCDGVIEGNVITENSAASGGGLFRCDGVIRNNVIKDNSATSGVGGGFALCSGVIEGNLITKNSGGGLARCPALIQDNTIAHNHAADGGGLYGCDHTIRNNVITGNSAPLHGGGLADCGGLIQNNIITDNHGFYGGGLYDCDGRIENNTIAGNYAGGLWECDGMVQGNVILANGSDKSGGGGLIYCDGIIQNNLIAGNMPGMGFCAAVIRNNTIVANRGGYSRWALDTCTGTISNCIIWANAGPDGRQIDDWNEPTYSCIQNWTAGGEGNIAQDPRFVDPDGADDDPETYEDNDYRLMPDSPCIDAGYNAFDLAASDISGMRRIIYGGKSLTVDMGAYEYYINEVHPGPGTGEATMSWSSVQGSIYVILYSEDLSTWILAEGALSSSGDKTTSWTDDGSKTGIPPSLAPRRFYRILENR